MNTPDDSSVSSVDSHQPYMGFDDNVEKRIRELARSSTQQSLTSSNRSVNKEAPADGSAPLDRVSTRASSIFSADFKGVNPVFSDEEEDDYDARSDPNSDEFSSKAWVQNMAKITTGDPEFYKPYSIGCCWKDSSASGESADVSYQSTFSNSPVKSLNAVWRKARPARESDTFRISKPMDGSLKPGESLVVSGRPGSGCTTSSKSISSTTHGFQISKDSVISYNGSTPNEIKKHYRGEVVYNAEADIHSPHSTVYQTLVTVARLKTPQNRVKGVTREDFANHVTDVAMATYGLSHTRDTKVGNDSVRGVSGGERKRVSIAEVWICGSKFQCWDNATRGLDSATASEFVRASKTQAHIAKNVATVAIYQCSQDAYNLFNKVSVLYEGYQIYFGDAQHAKVYFQKMGYFCPKRQTIPDFLTSITSPAERRINKEYLDKGIKVPQTPLDMVEYWHNSEEYKQLREEIDETSAHQSEDDKEEIKEAHIAKQSKRARPSSPYVVSYMMQVKYILIRNFWRIKNSASVTLFQVFGNSAMAFISGSMFYKIQKGSSADTFYFRGAAMFFAILFNAFSSLSEIFSLYEARPITEKHRTYSLYHPSADAFASVISEIPPKIVTAILFNIIFYFSVNFRRDAGRFFFYFLINVIAVFAMSHLFRCVGSLTKTLQEAMVPASMLLLALSMYTGFAIPRTKMLGWSKWIWYINPLAYLFESLMVNEFHDRRFPCNTYIPRGGAYNDVTGTERVCASVGARPGNDYVLGDDFLKESYDYENKHKWRGFGVGMAYVIFFFFVYLISCEFNEGAKQKGEMLVFPHSVVKRMKKEGKIRDKTKMHTDKNDIENNSESITSNATNEKNMLQDTYDENADSESITSGSRGGSPQVGLSKSEAIFHWQNSCYDVPIKTEVRRILNNVDGWVKPGTLTALMGASGAGKTTLLDCLAERTTMGVITGDVMVNGRPRDTSFSRSIGYCQQQDLHLKTATVRESLRFSAYLRQPSSVSIEEKNEYVEAVIKILEMETYADAVVGVPGEGLNVEQRKRLTIGVELAAKPKLLVFLDEPTSGLDSQTAWATCQSMKKSANHGQAILCTIHQPSAMLMQEFDRLSFLQKGGQTVYFGDLGKGCKTMIKYFEDHGAHKCPPDANPAEWMLEVVGAAPGSHANQDYHEVWRNSEQFKQVKQELEQMEKELSQKESDNDEDANKEFATSLWYQFQLVCVRLFQQYWRTPDYLWSKYILTIFNQSFIGFTFFKADHTLQGLQNQMLSIFMYTVIFNPLLQQYLPTFVQQRDLYEARERPSRTFSWKAFILAQIVVEVPWNIVAGTLAYCIYYYSVGFYANASQAHQLHERGALFWLFSIAFYVYVGSLGLFVISFNEVAETAAHIGSLMFTMALSFCGVMATPDAMPRFWIFMYRVSPLTYLIDALLSTGVANVDIRCSNTESVTFTPPQGLTCGQYMTPYSNVAGTGYLTDPSATDECHFCQFSYTNDFLATVSSKYYRRWRNYGIFICFIVFDYVAGIFLYWSARVPKTNGKIAKNGKTAKVNFIRRLIPF